MIDFSIVEKSKVELKRILLVSAIFFSLMLILSLNRYEVFASSDHGLFNQLFWNNLHGNFFQSSLSSANSSEAMDDGGIPSVSFSHLGEHFVPDFLLWLPLYALFPSPITLVVLQVSLMTAGGVVLYVLARHYLQPALALMMTIGYYAANAVIGPTFDNFYEQCQIPIFVFGLLLAMEKRRWVFFWILAVFTLGIREDAGLILFGIGLYLLLSRRYPWVGTALCLLSFAYVSMITTTVMPLFSQDSSRLYLSSKFQKFAEGSETPTTVQILLGMVTHPSVLLTNLLTPFDKHFFYLLRQWVPLAFVPVISGASWILVGVPLLELFAQSSNRALDINIRYAIALVPGLFYGAILWWSCHPKCFTPLTRYFWTSCITLSLVLTIFSNPNSVFYFLFPKSVLAHVSSPIAREWEHSRRAYAVMQTIPPNATVSATTYLVPHLSSRRGVLDQRFMKIKNDQGQVLDVDYLVADLWRLESPQGLKKYERSVLKSSLKSIDHQVAELAYGVVSFQDGVVLLQKGIPSDTSALESWKQFRSQLPVSSGKNRAIRTQQQSK